MYSRSSNVFTLDQLKVIFKLKSITRMNRKLHRSEVNTTNNKVDFLVIENIKSQKWLASMKPIKILFLLKKQDATINETSIV